MYVLPIYLNVLFITDITLGHKTEDTIQLDVRIEYIADSYDTEDFHLDSGRKRKNTLSSHTLKRPNSSRVPEVNNNTSSSDASGNNNNNNNSSSSGIISFSHPNTPIAANNGSLKDFSGLFSQEDRFRIFTPNNQYLQPNYNNTFHPYNNNPFTTANTNTNASPTR